MKSNGQEERRRHRVHRPAKRILKTKLFGDVPLPAEDYEYWVGEVARCARVEGNPNLTGDDLIQRLVDLAKANDMTLEEFADDLERYQSWKSRGEAS